MNPKIQAKYITYIQENIYDDVLIYFPVFDKITRPHRCRHAIIQSHPVYPGYIFAKIDTDSRVVHALVSCPVRARFVRFGGLIGMIPERVIMELRRLEIAKLLVREQFKMNPYTEGRVVRIHTPVADIQAMVVKLIHGSRVEVDTKVGRITVGVHQVQLQ
jgi:transcription antitermination factor NusG